MAEWTPSAQQIFDQALAMPSSEERQAFLDRACRHLPEVRQQIEAVLNAYYAGMAFPSGEPLFATKASGVAQVGSSIGPYKVLQQIGEGGFGRVFMAEQASPVRRRVAIKVIKPGMDTKEVIARFESERQALAMMDHPNIARVIDAGATDRGLPFFVMDLVKGIAITDFCDKNNLPTAERLKLFATVCHAVQHAHQKGIIHRDIKPSNILVALHDGMPVPTVIDFGVAKATSHHLTQRTLFTAVGQMIGTPAYMSPEQAEMSGLDIDTRSDIYSMGVLLYELLTGSTPFDAQRLREAGFVEMQRIIREEEPQKPSTRLSTLGGRSMVVAAHRALDPKRLRQFVRGDLDLIVMKSLHKDRGLRYETAAAFANDVERFLRHEAVVARAPSTTYRLRKFAQRNRVAVVGAAIVFGAMIAGTGVSLWQAAVARRERDSASLARSEEARQRQLAQERLVQVEAARAAEAEQRGRADQALQEYHAMLAQQYVGWGDQAVESGDLTGAMVWFAAALQEARGDPAKERPHRIRLGAVLRQCPRLAQVWVHEGSVTQAEYSPDGSLVLVVTGNSARLLNPDDGQLAAPLLDHDRPVLHAEFSADGRRLVTCSLDGVARIWDVQTGGRVGHDVVHGDRVNHASLSPDGRLVATAGRDNLARIWDAETGEGVIPPIAHDGPVGTASFAVDGRRLLTTSEGFNVCTAWVWDVGSGNLLAQSPSHQDDGVIDATFDPQGHRVVSYYMSDIGGGWVWGVDNGRSAIRVAEDLDLRDAQFSPDGRRLVVASAGDDGGVVRILDAANGKAVGTEIRQTRAVNCARWRPDGGGVATACDDGTVRVWAAEDGSPLTPPFQHARAVDCVRFSPDGRHLLTSCVDGSVRIWDLAADQPEVPPLVVGDSSDELARSPGGRRIALGTREGAVTIVDLDNGRENNLPDAHLGSVEVLRFSPDGRWLATGSSANSARLWDADTGRPVTPLLQHEMGVYDLRFSPDGRRLATSMAPWQPRATSGHDAGAVRVWDTASGAPCTDSLPMSFTGYDLRFSQDGQRLLACCRSFHDQKCEVHVWDSETGVPVRVFRLDRVLESARFSPDGRQLIAISRHEFTGRGDAAIVWDLSTGEQLFALEHSGGVLDAEFGPDGRTVATACADGAVRLWDLATGAARGAAMRHDASVWFVDFDREEHHLITMDREGRLRAFDPDTCRPVTPNFKSPWAIGFVDPDGWIISRQLYFDSPTPVVVPADQASIAHWRQVAELHSGRRLDAAGGLVPVDARSLGELFRAVGLKHRAGGSSAAAWHQREATSAANDRRWGAAAWHFRRLLAAGSSDRPARLAEAVALVRDGRGAEGIVRLTEFLQASPDDAVALRIRARAYQKLQYWKEAAADLARVPRGRCLDTYLFGDIAVLQVKAGDLAAYRRCCAEMVVQFGSVPADRCPYNDLAWRCIYAPDALANTADIVDLAEKAIAQEGRRPAMLNTLGAALFRAGRFEEAVQAFEEGIRGEGHEGDCSDWIFLAMSHWRLGHVGDATRYFDKATAWQGTTRSGTSQDTDRRWDQRLVLDLLYEEATLLLGRPGNPNLRR